MKSRVGATYTGKINSNTFCGDLHIPCDLARDATFAQIAYCTSASGWRLWDFRAVRLLRACLILHVIRPSCSTVTALGPYNLRYGTFVQYGYCALVGRLTSRLTQLTQLTYLTLKSHRRACTRQFYGIVDAVNFGYLYFN